MSKVKKLSLSRVTSIGMIWLIFQNTSSRAIGFFSQLVIATILSPADFGVIGLTFTVSSVGAILVTSGVDSVLLQRQKSIRFWIVPAVWCTFGLGCLGFAAVVAVSPLISRVYHLPQVVILADIVAVSMPLSALGTVPNILLRARFAFREFAIINFVEVVAIQGLTIALAYGGAGAFSFVIPLPLVAAAKTLALWLIIRPPMRTEFKSFRRVKYLFGSSAAVFVNGLIMMIIGQGDYVILGLLATESVVGVYFFAFKMGSQPLLLMASSLSGVLFPALSKLRNTPLAQAHAAFRAAKMLGLIIMPTAFLQAALIEPAIHIFFRTKWDASIPLMQILSVGLGFDAISWVAGSLQTAKRGFGRQLVYTASVAPVFIALVFTGGYLASATGVAAGVAVFYISTSPIYSYLVFRHSGVTPPRLAWVYLMPAALAAIAVAAAIWVSHFIEPANYFGRIAVTIATFCPVYLVLLRIVDAAGFEDGKTLVINIVRR